jgi:hypothetical protein
MLLDEGCALVIGKEVAGRGSVVGSAAAVGGAVVEAVGGAVVAAVGGIDDVVGLVDVVAAGSGVPAGAGAAGVGPIGRRSVHPG